MTLQFAPVILAGGKGERFWPLSRLSRPKQFLSLDGSGKTLLETTAERLLAFTNGWTDLWVVTASHLAEQVRSQLPELPESNLLVEPQGQDTAPAVTWATLEIANRMGNDAIAGFFPADHWIGDPALFQATVQATIALAAQQDVIVTMGIKPTQPATGYGYIEQGEPIGTVGAGFTAYQVARFTEKPDLATAESFLASGRFSWNSGMFIFRTGVALAELAIHAPEIYNPLKTDGVSVYPTLPKKSIDYALMEKTQKAAVLPVTFAWDDLGDWNALERLGPQPSGNVELANHVGLDSTGTIFYSANPDDVVVSLGVDDLVVVRDGNVTLVMKKQRSQDIKKVLEKLRAHPDYKKLLD
jgi:mannose-1-phosphate guanylyltransferase